MLPARLTSRSPPPARRHPSRRSALSHGLKSSIHSSLEEASVPLHATSLITTACAAAWVTVELGVGEWVGVELGVAVALAVGVEVVLGVGVGLGVPGGVGVGVKEGVRGRLGVRGGGGGAQWPGKGMRGVPWI